MKLYFLIFQRKKMKKMRIRQASVHLFSSVGAEACRRRFFFTVHHQALARPGKPRASTYWTTSRSNHMAVDLGGLRTGSPPSPPPPLIRPSRRRLQRSPRLSGPGPLECVILVRGRGCQRRQHPTLCEALPAWGHGGDSDNQQWCHFSEVLRDSPWRRPA